MKSLLILALLIPLISGIITGHEGGRRPDSSSSWSSEEHGGRGHHHGGGRPRPPIPSSRCEQGWMAFNRTGYTWCVKVFYQDLNADAAESMCQAQAARLTGLQTSQERMRVADGARALIFQNGGVLVNVWLGGRRKANCPNKPSCDANHTFDWTDGRTTGIDGFFFSGTEPTATPINGHGIQSCLQLLPSLADNLQSNFGYNHGALDDVHCHLPQRTYACGKVSS